MPTEDGGTGLLGDCELPNVGSGNSGPLERKDILLTAEPSLQVLRLASFDMDSSHAPLDPGVTAAQRAEAIPRPR